MDAFELFISKTLRGESEAAVADHMGKELQRIARLVTLLDPGREQFPKLNPSSSRLDKCKVFADHCRGELTTLRRDGLLFSSICFTQTQLKAVSPKVSEINVYVEAYLEELSDAETQKFIAQRLGLHLKCEFLRTCIFGLKAAQVSGSEAEGINLQGESYLWGDLRLC